MLTLLGSILGFVGSAIPEVVGIFKEKEKNKNELEIMKLQVEAVKQQATLDLMNYRAMAQDKEHERVIEHDIAIQNSSGPLSWLSKSVRPVITYLFFALFASVKIASLSIAMEDTGNFQQAILLVWDEETQGMFAAIISYWFGRRALEKMNRK